VAPAVVAREVIEDGEGSGRFFEKDGKAGFYRLCVETPGQSRPIWKGEDPVGQCREGSIGELESRRHTPVAAGETHTECASYFENAPIR